MVVVLLALGIAQPALLVLAFSRVVDPGWVTFETLGTIVGIGMAVAAAIVGSIGSPRVPALFRVLTVIAIVAGLVHAAAWFTLLGRTFYTDDVLRAGLLVASDVLFAAWIVTAAIIVMPPRAPNLWPVGLFLALRAAVEVWLFAPLTIGGGGPAGPSSGALVLVVAGTLFFGYVLLATWELTLAKWLATSLRLREQ